MRDSVSRREDVARALVVLPEFGLHETSLGKRRTKWSYFCLGAAADTDSGPDIRTTLIRVGLVVLTVQNSRLGPRL
jgi:hypothetical protein